MADFILGVVTLPLLAAVVIGVASVSRAVAHRWRRWRPTFIGNEEHRARHAASLAVSRRVLVINLPGSRVLAWRSNVTSLSEPATQASAYVQDAIQYAIEGALQDAGRDKVVLRDESRYIFDSTRDAGDPGRTPGRWS